MPENLFEGIKAYILNLGKYKDGRVTARVCFCSYVLSSENPSEEHSVSETT